MEQLVDVGGRRLRALSLGEATPTVVLETGLGQTLETWRLVQPELTAIAHVVAYDRAGLGGSDPAPRPRSCADLAADLHALLTALAAPPPYVLVGHSLGGLVVRLYADRHPEHVAGMVLVDAPHPAYPARALELLPPEAPDEHPEVADSRRFFGQLVHATDDPNDNPEGLAWGASLAHLLASRSLGDRPLVVLSAGQPAAFEPGFPPDLAARVSALVRACQRDLLLLSTQAEHVVARSSGHMIQLDQPDLVVEAVRSVLRRARPG